MEDFCGSDTSQHPASLEIDINTCKLIVPFVRDEEYPFERPRSAGSAPGSLDGELVFLLGPG